MLDAIRLAMSDETAIARGTGISRAGLNLGVVLMYAGLWPALLALIASPGALPIAFLMLTVAFIAIVFGSGWLLRLFQTEELHPEIVKARRKEIAFGSTLMYLTAILVTMIVAAGVPDSWAKILLIGKVTAGFIGLLALSKPLYAGYRSLTSNGPVMLQSGGTNRELTTGQLGNDVEDLRIPQRDVPSDADLLPASVTEGTTRSLDKSE